MPLYEYQCESCGRRFERIQRFSDPPVDSCPSCGAAVRKLPSSPAIQFKGTGWYITDYARKGGAEKSKGDAEKSKGDAGADGKSGETTTEKKTDTAAEKPAEKGSTQSESAKTT